MKKTKFSDENIPELFLENYEVTVNKINSTTFNVDDQVLDTGNSKLNDLKLWWANYSAKIYKWYISHPVTFYIISRVIYSLIILVVGLIILALILHTQVDEVIFDPENKEALRLSPEAIVQLRNQRMEAFGFDPNIGKFLGNFLTNLLPFIPKVRMIGFTFEKVGTSDIVITSQTYETVLVYLGVTFRNNIAQEGAPVMDILANAIPISLAIGGPTILVVYLVSIPLGIEAAKRNGKAGATLINGTSTIINAVPGLIITLLIYILATSVFHTSSLYSNGSPWTRIWPALTVFLMYSPVVIMNTRRFMLDEMNSDYGKFAFSQGFSKNKIFYVYIFRNAGIRILINLPIDLFLMFLGISMLIEKQWQIPGMSSVIVASASGSADPFVVLGYITFSAFMTIFSKLLSDLMMIALDPRVSLKKSNY